MPPRVASARRGARPARRGRPGARPRPLCLPCPWISIPLLPCLWPRPPGARPGWRPEQLLPPRARLDAASSPACGCGRPGRPGHGLDGARSSGLDVASSSVRGHDRPDRSGRRLDAAWSGSGRPGRGLACDRRVLAARGRVRRRCSTRHHRSRPSKRRGRRFGTPGGRAACHRWARCGRFYRRHCQICRRRCSGVRAGHGPCLGARACLCCRPGSAAGRGRASPWGLPAGGRRR